MSVQFETRGDIALAIIDRPPVNAIDSTIRAGLIQAAGRANADQVTCFINNLGLGYQFAVAGSVVYRKARETGAGRELPTEWFTEDVHP